MRPSRTTIVFGALILNLTMLPSLGSAMRGDAQQVGVAGATDIAFDHVASRRAALGLTKADLSTLVVTDAYRSSHNGVAHVYLGQAHNGIRVAGPAMTVNVDRSGRVIHAPSRLMAGVAAAASGQDRIGPAGALAQAASALDLGLERAVGVLSGPTGADRRTLLTSAGISLGPIPARLVYQPVPGGRLRLAWSVEIEELSEEHWWMVSVDASTGRVLDVHDLVIHDSAEATSAAVSHEDEAASETPLVAPPDPASDGARYRVYALPLESPNDGPRTLVQNPADTFSSPFGWHDTNGVAGAEATTTKGNNVHAYVDPTPGGNQAPAPALPLMDADGGASLTFDHPLDFSLPPAAWKDAAVTNLFYWNNIIQDVFYRYGFDEASGNFQTNQYGHSGTGNDSVQAEAQDGSGVNNANFATPADGSRPRMQMYVWPNTAKNQVIDGDLDSGVITHEYGHGISNRLTGGPSTTSCLRNQEQMGEGWSDWLALALTARPGETGPQRRGMGTYVLGQTDRQKAGIRPRPYSTNMSINGAKYDTIKTSAVPHGVGYVWASMLWEVYWALVGQYGFNPDVYGHWTTGGNNLAIQLVMDGMKFQPCSPGFVDGRDAIIAANEALTEGEQEATVHCLVWEAFAKRGLGVSATQGSSSSSTDGRQAFDLPVECGG